MEFKIFYKNRAVQCGKIYCRKYASIANAQHQNYTLFLQKATPIVYNITVVAIVVSGIVIVTCWPVLFRSQPKEARTLSKQILSRHRLYQSYKDYKSCC